MLKGLIGGLCGLVVMAGASWTAAVSYINADGSRLAERYLQPFGGKGRVQYGAVEKSLFSRDLTIRNLRIRTPDGQTVRIANILVSRYDWLSAKNPAYADVTVTSLVADAAAFGPRVQQEAAKAGLKQIDATIRYAFSFDDEAQQLRIETVRITVKGVGTLTLEAAFAGVPRLDLSESGLRQVLLTAKIAKATATFADGDLAKRIVQAQAAAAGLPPEKARAALLTGLSELEKEARNSLLKEIYGAFRAYIAKPGRITVAVSPARPVRLATLAPVFFVSPREVKRMLNLKISTSALKP